MEAEFEEDLSKDEASAEIAEIADEEIPTEKVNAVIPKTENIIENDYSEEEEYVNTLEKDQHESPEEIVAEDEQTEPVAETEEISEESKEDASITETEPVITEEETAAEEEEEEGRGMKQRPQRRLFQQKKSMLMKRKKLQRSRNIRLKNYL